MKQLLIAWILANTFFILAACEPPPGPGPEKPGGDMGQPSKVTFLPCWDPGGGVKQEVAKQPRIKNTSGQEIPEGRIIRWASSDDDSGKTTLQNPLPPNEVVLGTGEPPIGGYSCIAWIWSL